MIIHALEKETERAAWDIWIAQYPYFSEETFVPFAEFVEKQKQPTNIKTFKTDEEIMEEMLKVVENYETRKEALGENI